jgi:hypothetical protein
LEFCEAAFNQKKKSQLTPKLFTGHSCPQILRAGETILPFALNRAEQTLGVYMTTTEGVPDHQLTTSVNSAMAETFTLMLAYPDEQSSQCAVPRVPIPAVDVSCRAVKRITVAKMQGRLIMWGVRLSPTEQVLH